MPAHLEYEHGYPTLWVVAKLPKPPEEYKLSWPRWAAEESVVKVSEVSETIEVYGYNRAFWRVWRYLEWLPLVVAAEEAGFVRRAKNLTLLYKVKWSGYPEYYSAYIAYTNKPFSVLVRQIA